ncbi:Protein of unknown function DUF599 - like 7, partial [Theobroma cacao]
MVWKEYLDVVLVPSGSFFMSAYHVFLLYRCLKFPQTTVIGYENHMRKAWVERMLQVEAKDRGLSLATINSEISAATFMATISLALSSLIGTWLGNSSHNSYLWQHMLINHFCQIHQPSYLLPSGFWQLVHSSFLISMPNADIPAVIWGSTCWSVGLRAIYYATTLLLWIFGPLPMFAASVIMVLLLHMLDRNVTPLHMFEHQPTAKTFLVPSGSFFMSAYHVFLLYRCLKFPQTTVIGYENHMRKAWVERMLQVEAKDRGLSLATINSEISAATFMATISLALSSLIGTWLGNSSHNSYLWQHKLINHFCQIHQPSYLLPSGFWQLVHSSFLISMPNADIPAVIWGSTCWSVGLRAIYYATTLLLWIFGPLPMFAASVIMVLLLHMLDRNVTPLHMFEHQPTAKTCLGRSM